MKSLILRLIYVTDLISNNPNFFRRPRITQKPVFSNVYFHFFYMKLLILVKAGCSYIFMNFQPLLFLNFIGEHSETNLFLIG